MLFSYGQKNVVIVMAAYYKIGKEIYVMESAMMNHRRMETEDGRQPYRTIGQKQNEIWQTAIEALLDLASKMDAEQEKKYMQRIEAKLKSGKKLTTDELNYLKIHNYSLYLIAMRIQNAKERLENQLKNCKSKEEVNDVVSIALSIGDKDPDKEYMMAALNETIQKFRQNNQYARLPERSHAHGDKKKKHVLAIGRKKEDEKEQLKNYTPIQELLDTLPTFNVIQ